MSRGFKTAALCGVVLALATVFPAGLLAGESGSGELYQMVISRNPEMTIVNGQGTFTILVRGGTVRAYLKNSSGKLKLVKTGHVYRAVDDQDSPLLVFAVLDAGGHGTQIVYPHHADTSNSRARIGLTVGTLEEAANMEDQRALLREKIQHFGVDSEQALLVRSVVAGSVAAEAGLQFGDVVVQVGEFADPSPVQFQQAVYDAPEGSRLPLTVLRPEGRQQYELLMPAIPAPIDAMALELEIAQVLTTDWSRD